MVEIIRDIDPVLEDIADAVGGIANIGNMPTRLCTQFLGNRARGLSPIGRVTVHPLPVLSPECLLISGTTQSRGL